MTPQYRHTEILTGAGRRVGVPLQQVSGGGGGLPAANRPGPDVFRIIFVIHRRSSLLKYRKLDQVVEIDKKYDIRGYEDENDPNFLFNSFVCSCSQCPPSFN